MKNRQPSGIEPGASDYMYMLLHADMQVMGFPSWSTGESQRMGVSAYGDLSVWGSQLMGISVYGGLSVWGSQPMGISVYGVYEEGLRVWRGYQCMGRVSVCPFSGGCVG